MGLTLWARQTEGMQSRALRTQTTVKERGPHCGGHWRGSPGAAVGDAPGKMRPLSVAAGVTGDVPALRGERYGACGQTLSFPDPWDHSTHVTEAERTLSSQDSPLGDRVLDGASHRGPMGPGPADGYWPTLPGKGEASRATASQRLWVDFCVGSPPGNRGPTHTQDAQPLASASR